MTVTEDIKIETFSDSPITTPEQKKAALLEYIDIQTDKIDAMVRELKDTVTKALLHPEKEIIKDYFAGWEGQKNYTYHVKD